MPVGLPVPLVVRYRAVDTPSHLDALAEDIARHGIRTPLRLGLTTVPVTVVREPSTPRPARPMRAADFAVLAAAAGK
ncbi:hypothetical protein ACWEHA_23750 [Amycolatopsis nivea]